MSPFYVYFYREGRDAHEQLVVVPEETFKALWPHRDALESTYGVPHGVMDAATSLLKLPHVDLRESEYADIPDDHFIRVTLY